MNAHIYCVTNLLNGKQYVGQTVVNGKVGHGIAITTAYKKYGKANFSYDKICVGIDNRNTLNLLERFWIKTFGSLAPDGYNIESGGTDKGDISDTTREKLRIANTGKIMPQEVREKIRVAMTGDKNPFYGKTHSQEAIAKIIAANIGKTVIHSDETKKKLRALRLGALNPMYGKAITSEHREKLKANSARNRYWIGKKFSDEHKAHLSVERVCPHCNKIGKGNAMIRHHFDNCRALKG